jgi:ribosome biogenesis GTPase
MNLEDYGYNESIEKLRLQQNLTDFSIGRVIAEHKERYEVATEVGDLEAEITGNLRFAAKGRKDFPAVGDWVVLIPYDDEAAIIHQILPRSSVLKRQAAGQRSDVQIIAANIDFAFIVQAVDRDFNINRLERYLTICYASKVNPAIVLTKTDLANKKQLFEITGKINKRIENVPLFTISNETLEGLSSLKQFIEKGKTYCMIGSSGVGKSTLLNNLSGKAVMKTGAISAYSERGRHVTSHRELMVLESGGILVDNPGMREVGITDATSGLETTFDKILNLAEACRFKDCTHTSEAGCAVVKAVENGEIEQSAYENYLKMEREKAHFESNVAERRKKEKELAKVVKNYKRDKKRNKL